MAVERIDQPPRLGFGAVAVVLTGAYVAAFAHAMEHSTYNVWGALIVGPALVVVSYPLLRAAALRDSDPRFGKLIAWAFGLKLAGAMARYAVAFQVYEGNADAAGYDDWGTRIAETFRAGHINVDLGRELTGTGFIRLLTGMVYYVIGPTRLGGFLVFSAFGFWGCYLFYRAFVLAVPEGDHYRYAKFVLLLPSLLFWPSSLGKEAWMLFALGLAAYGAARVFARKRGAFAVLALGLGATSLVRPHMTAVLAAAVLVGYVLRPRPANASVLSPVYKVVGLVVMAAAVAVVLSQAQEFFGVESLDTQSVGGVLTNTQDRTAEGASTFRATGVHSPTDLPKAALTVLFRPFPFEAQNVQQFGAAVEGAVLLLISFRAWPRLRSFWVLSRRRPYLSFAVAYSLMFIIAFSNFNNFGLLTRQRVQVLPMVLVLLALPLPEQLNRATAAQQHGPRRRELVPLGRP